MEQPIEALRAELAERNRQLAAIHRICDTLSTETAIEDLLKETLAEALQAVHADAGSILLYDATRDQLVFQHVVGPAKETLLGYEIEPSRGICGRVFTTGQPSIDPDVSRSPDHATEVDDNTGYVTRNMVTIPLMSAAGEPIGVLQVLNKRQGQAMFDEQDIDVLMAMSAYAAAIREARLAEVVRRMGNVSHDIKNMISPLVGCAQTLQKLLNRFFRDLDEILAAPSLEREQVHAALREKLAPLRDFYPEAIRVFLESSHQMQDRMQEIVDCVKGLLAEPALESLSINDVVTEVATSPQLRFDVKMQGLTIDTEGLSDTPLVPLDRKLLFNALFNLIHNAIHETPAGGVIWVRTCAQTGGGPFPEGHYVQIEVADNGRGMSEQVRQRLFTREAISTKPGGTGLGMRIVKTAVDAHKGVISVDSQPGVGTTFQIRIPLEQAETRDRGTEGI